MANFTCKLCTTDFNRARPPGDICGSCRTEHGLRLPSEPARPRIPCLRCNSTTFVRVRMRERASTEGSGTIRSVARPSVVTFALREDLTLWKQRHDGYSPDLSERIIGALDAYVCRDCGYTELYTDRPTDIPIDEACGTELFEVGTDAPYR